MPNAYFQILTCILVHSGFTEGHDNETLPDELEMKFYDNSNMASYGNLNEQGYEIVGFFDQNTTVGKYTWFEK